MELDEVKSDLYALRQLYGLLQSLVTRENVCKSLNERALQLLKSLLDNATQKLSTTHEMKADYHQSNALNMQDNITKPDQIVPSQPYLNTTTNNIIGDQQMMINADLASSSTGFSTPTSIGFDGDIDDPNSDDQHGTFSKEVSNAIKQIDSCIFALHVDQTSGSRVSYPSHAKPKLKDVDTESVSRPTSRYVRGLRIPSPVDSNDNVYRNSPIFERHVARNPKPRTNNTRTHHGRIELYENQRSSEPKNYSIESGSAYSSANEEEEENSQISPSEVSESDDHYGYDDYDNDYDDDDDDDDDDPQSCSSCSRSSSNSSYGTAKSWTSNYPRRRVEDSSERGTRISTLRRIKNKLGLIFHHHHHHHHHQYHHGHNHSPLDHDHCRSSTKPLQRMFCNENNNKRERYDRHHQNNNKIPMRRGVVEHKRSSDNRGGGGAGGEDGGHFRALVDALTRHVGGGRRIKRGGVVKIVNYRRGRVGVGFNKKTNQPYKLKM